MSDGSSEKKAVEMVTITVDGKQIQVPKGTNLIDAAASAGIDIPHYCYHPHLSIAGNCRMCQVEIQGSPKLGIACNTMAAEGLTVKTHFTSEQVAESQRATLEFLLINHPLDCTVCDQAGHCKLQDYYYEYDGKGSRFVENKVDKVKAEPLGSEVIYDGERCIMCTRCVRFCDEVTHTSELGAFNRGDRGIIGVIPGKELENPLSGSVVDLCPVGALTHRRWRFNTRIWYTGQENSICTGCSTGCNIQAAVRDDRIVHVKARLNGEVNQEWMCNEGRYGFDRFQPPIRATEPAMRKGDSLQNVGWKEALEQAKKLSGSAGSSDAAVFLSPFLTLEEIWVALELAEKTMGVTWASGKIAVQIQQRSLTPEESILVSPDYAPNARALAVFGLGGDDVSWRSTLEKRYQELLGAVRRGDAKRILLVGDFAVREEDADAAFQSALQSASISVAISPRASGGLNGQIGGGAHEACHVVLPGITVNEKSGLMVNRDGRIQRLRSLLTAPFGSLSDWLILNRIAAACQKAVVPVDIIDDRGLFREMVKRVPALSGLTLQRVGDAGIRISEISGQQGGASGKESGPAATA
ncbi:MAG: 2Fe-2S iron-sulfur cluster-binding protein [Bdellovibrionota bacterium]